MQAAQRDTISLSNEIAPNAALLQPGALRLEGSDFLQRAHLLLRNTAA